MFRETDLLLCISNALVLAAFTAAQAKVLNLLCLPMHLINIILLYYCHAHSPFISGTLTYIACSFGTGTYLYISMHVCFVITTCMHSSL